MKVCLYGASGFTGTLIAHALAAQKVPLILSGRSPKRLGELAEKLAGADVEVRAAPADAPAALAEAMDGASIVVSAAGPFSQIGEPIIAAAIAAGASYLDTTGEQAFMRDIYERYESRARKRKVAVVPGFAFEVALGDLAAAIAARSLGIDAGAPADEVIIGYAFDEFHTSRGTRLSMIEALAAGALIWDRDRWEAVAPAAERRHIAFPAPFGVREAVSFPSGEVVTVPRHISTRRAQAYVAYGTPGSAMRLTNRALSLLGPAMSPLFKSALGETLRGAMREFATAPDDGHRRASRFAITAECRRGFSRARIAVRGADPYGLTAHIVAHGVRALAEPHIAGVLAPAHIVEDPEATLEVLCRDANLTLERG